MAYAPYMAAALSGATRRQLSHWRRTNSSSGAVLVPEVSVSRPVLYSFRDVVALRTCVFLRKDSSLQRIRRAIANLRSLGELDHLSEYKLVSDNDSIVLAKDESAVDLVKQPGQYVMAEMSEVLRPFVNKSNIEVPALFRPRDHIAVSPEVRSGHPVISGTRVPYEKVAELLQDGVPMESVHDYYPAVDAAAAQDAYEFAQYVDSWRDQRRQQGAA